MVLYQNISADLPQLGRLEMSAGPAFNTMQGTFAMYIPHAFTANRVAQRAIYASPNRMITFSAVGAHLFLYRP
jgi:hypothetical protein